MAPIEWVVFIPAPMAQSLQEGNLMSPYRALWFLGLAEAIMGLLLVLGLLTRIACFASAILLAVVVAWSGFDQVGVRDIGLLGLALLLLTAGPGDWSLDSLIRRLQDLKEKPARFPALRPLTGGVAGICVTCVVLLLAVPETDEFNSHLGVGMTLAALNDSVRDEPIQPIPKSLELDPKKVQLGKMLFHDPVLSADGSISCASCHDLSKGGTDQRKFSIGIREGKGSRNAPTVFNSAFSFKQNWDGSADSLEDQIDGPINNPHEMGNDWTKIVWALQKDARYAPRFKELYPDGITRTSIKDALATFERSLITPSSRFDQWLRGDDESITAEELEGYQIFKDVGCVVCHQGVNLGGNMFQTMGKMADYFGDRGNTVKSDLGRYNVTGKDRDRYKFKVPTLRNIALTAPYFHNGAVETLDEAISVMGRYQLGASLSAD